MLHALPKPWLSVYKGRISDRTIEGSLTDFLKEAARKYRERVALTFQGQETTYAELLQLSERFAAVLATAGVKKGDRVALMLPNCPEYVIGFFGIVRLGAVAVQVNPNYVGGELKHILNNSRIKMLILHQTAYLKVKEVQAQTLLENILVVGSPERGLKETDTTFSSFIASASTPAPEVEIDPIEDLASLQYTGGTTGVPKGTMLTHRNLVATIQQTIDLLIEDSDAFPADGKVVAVAPLFHIFGLTMVMLKSIRLGLNQLLVARFQVDELMELIKRERPVMLAGVATLYIALHRYPNMEEYGRDSVLLYTSGGASVRGSVLHSFERRTGRAIYEGYGLSEGAPVSFNTYLAGPRGGSIGMPLPSTDVQIVDVETGENAVPIGESGELIVKGPQVMKGYWNMPEETVVALRSGWLYTGDIARMDEDGFLYIVDRKKDMINVSGYKVYPREVEEVLYQHPEVVEAIAIGTPDEYKGEVVKVFVVKKQGSTATEEELVEYCKENLAPYKVPKETEFRDELPKSAVGKLLRRKLAEEECEKAEG